MDQLLIGYQKLNKPLSTNTIAWWLKNVMAKAGIDNSAYKAHSRRAAVTSVTRGEQVLIDTILSTAGWRSESTFARFYDKPIQDTVKNSGGELWLFQPDLLTILLLLGHLKRFDI